MFTQKSNAALAQDLANADIHLIQLFLTQSDSRFWGKLVTLAAKHASQAPLVVEYVGPDNYRAALACVRNAMRAAGVEEI